MKERTPPSLKQYRPMGSSSSKRWYAQPLSFMLHEYPHFNPNNYGLDVKIAVVKSGFHCKFNINYHLVWIPKTRSKVLQERVARIVRNVAIQVCKKNEWTPLAMEVMPEHIHLFLSAPPKWAPSDIIKRIKGNVLRHVRMLFKEFKAYREKELWGDSYYCGTAGHVSQEQVIRYIAEQDKALTDIKPFSYSIFDKKQKTLADGKVS